MNVWNPNAKLGDLPLMTLTSWMSHEEAKAKEVKRVLIKEETKPLYINLTYIFVLIYFNG